MVPQAAPPQAVVGETPPAKTARAETPAEVPPVRFVGRRELDGEMDMTPMVDMTFLLLIFFMVTAAYSLQRSLEIPPPDRHENVAQARTLEEVEQDDDYVIVEIHGDNTIFVDQSPASSEQELLVRLREAREGVPGSGSKGPSSLLVLASGECRHETVVMALDAGNAVGMENIRLATREEEF
jgi:biopolymer transport protein ExbD